MAKLTNKLIDNLQLKKPSYIIWDVEFKYLKLTQ